MTAPRAFVVDLSDPETVKAAAELNAHYATATADKPAGAVSAELAKKLEACAERAAARRQAEAKITPRKRHVEMPAIGTDELALIRARYAKKTSE